MAVLYILVLIAIFLIAAGALDNLFKTLKKLIAIFRIRMHFYKKDIFIDLIFVVIYLVIIWTCVHFGIIIIHKL
jgi:hypothetical protein